MIILYSILLKQYVINKKTHNYYELLSKFSDPDNVFSQVQLGNIPSNIKSEINPVESKCFFEVSSITTKRFFINREDITDPHYTNYVTRAFCNDRPSPLVEDQYGNSPLLELLKNGYAFFDLPPDPSTSKPYILIGKECWDCCRVCNPVVPDFWID